MKLSIVANEIVLVNGGSPNDAIAGLWLMTGFDQRPAAVRKHGHSRSTYTFRRKLSQAVNAITSFSNAPLLMIFNVGMFIFLLSVSYAGYLVVQWFFFAGPLSGWTSVMVSIWVLGGLIISFVEIVGIYVSKILRKPSDVPIPSCGPFMRLVGNSRIVRTPDSR